MDSKDPGKVIQEKNEKLKAMHAGYKYEQQSIREKVTQHVQKKLSQEGM
jgi:hypothetical protein